MFGFVFSLISFVLRLYKLLVLVYLVLNLLKVPANKWISLLASVIEPVLNPIRKLLSQYLPKDWQIIDWSPVALWLAITIIQWLL